MTRRTYIIILLMFFAFFVNLSKINGQEYISKRISTLNGLSQNDIQSIFQDSKGFMWIATNGGLNRYDGYSFKNYGIDYGGLNSNLILSIDEDKYGNLWIGTADRGLFLYDRSKDSFIPINLKEKGQLNDFSCKKLLVDDFNRIWFYNTSSHIINLMYYDYKNNKVSSLLSYSLLDADITDFVYSNNSIYFAINSGLYECLQKGPNLIVSKKSALHCRILTKLTPSILLSTVDKNIYMINLRTNSEKLLHSDEFVRNMVLRGNYLYYSTTNGVYRLKYNKAYEEFTSKECISSYKSYISQCIYLDKNNSIWVGFLKNAIVYLRPNLKPIEYYNSFGNNHISSIISNNDNLYLGTEGSGLFEFNENSKIITHIPNTTDKVIYSSTVSSYDNKLYIGIQGDGLYSYSKNIGKNELESDLLKDIRILLADGEYIWIGTYNNFLYRYSIKNKSLVGVVNHENLKIVRNLIKDKNGNIWIATDKGFYIIKSKERFTLRPVISCVKNNISSDYIIPMFEDRESNIWYGTLGHGLKKIVNPLSSKNSKIISYTTKSGLSSNTIKGIVQDNNGCIWISTNKGIDCLNPRNQKIESLDISDGLQDYEFNELSFCKMNDGSILFGGVNGLNRFNPKNFKSDISKSTPVLTDFKLFNESVSEDSIYRRYFDKSLETTSKVELPYNMNSFTFVFSALNYINSHKIKYEYKLEGVDENWVTTTADRREASYTKLSPGTYLFRLRASNSDGLWNSKELTFTVVIDPPFWLAWYSYLTYALILIFVAYRIKRFYSDRIRRKNEIYIANLEKKKSEEMLEMKTNFFTNISHELRTPMTLILSPLQLITNNKKYSEDQDLSKLLQVINHNGNMLMRLVNELLSFSKNEAGKLNINFKYDNFSAFSKHIYQQFTYLANEKGIILDYSVSDNNIFLYFDPYLMEQIIYNLISNAIKHTPKGGFVSFSVVKNDEKVVFSISDSGQGIADNMQAHIFERFYSDSTNVNKGGTGIGLYLTKRLVEMHNGDISFKSESGKGTIFIVELPLKAESKDDESNKGIINNDIIVEPKVQDNNSIASTENIENDDEGDAADLDITDDNKRRDTILVVDDNNEICIILKNLLKDIYNIEVAEDGEDAWIIIPSLQPDLVLSDIMMSRMNGLQLCEKIKSDEKTSHIPVILLTAKSTEEDYTIGYHFQADAYCTKPFNNEMLKEMINSILTNRKRLINSKENHFNLNPSEVTTTSTDEKFLHKLIKIVEDNMSNSEFQVYDLCTGVGVTSLILNKKLKTLLGITANVFIRNIRLKRAATLLKTGRYSVSEITYDVGFNDLKYFRECFKKEFGMLPQQYKDEYSNKEEDINK